MLVANEDEVGGEELCTQFTSVRNKYYISTRLVRMNIKVFEDLFAAERIDADVLQKVKTHEATKQVSVRRELLILLYFGIILLSTGLGIVIYENIDSIGHITIVLLIAAAAVFCFIYCFRKSAKPSFNKVESPNIWFDYVLLLGCLLLLILIGYVQVQYQFFGNRWGLATFIPFVILAFSAYYFDHLGVLSLAITNLAAWMGISINIMQVRGLKMFSSEPLIYSGILLAGLLLALSFLSGRRNIKEHFAFTYQNFGVHILFIALLSGMFILHPTYLLWFLALAGFAVYVFLQARRHASLYFVVVSVLYFYIALSYVVMMALWDRSGSSGSEGLLYLTIFYFIGSATGLVLFLSKMNKQIRGNESI